MTSIVGTQAPACRTAAVLSVDVPSLRRHEVARLCKSVADRSVAAVLLLVLLPAVLLIALLVCLDSPGPALFRQRRVGRDGAQFWMLKLRSMTTGAEAELPGLLAANEHGVDGVLFKLRHDPRVTRIGRVLRRTSLDELPQLLNVLTGSMSLVGPRPPLPAEVVRYDARQWGRLSVRPGLTGLWQISGRSELSFERAVELDLQYVERWSPALDIKILWGTVAAVVRGTGAY